MSPSRQTTTSPLRLEIHTHTNISDGQYTVERLAELCEQTSVDVWALTDHDTCEGCPEAAALARERGIQFFPGIEVSAFDQGSIHVLGYGVDPEHPSLKRYAQRMHDARRKRMEKMIQKVGEMGYEVTFEEVEALSTRGTMGRPHLARAMYQRGYVRDPQEAFDRFIGENKPAYEAMTWLSVPEALRLINEVGGIAVLAHPGRYAVRDKIPRWAEEGLAGLEVRHPSHELSHEQWLGRTADELGLLKTASSDFHGVPEGENPADRFGKVNFPEEWAEAFLDRVLQRQ